MPQEEDPKLSDFLVTAFEFQLGPTTSQENNENDANSWSGYDWKFSECGTPHPTPRSNYATLFVKYKHNDGTIRIVQGHSSEQEELDEEDDRIRIYYQDFSSASGDDSSSHYLRGVAYPQEDLVVVDNVNDMGQEPPSASSESSSSSTTWTIGVFHVASQQDYEFACQLAEKDPKHRVVLKHEETSLVLESQEDEEVVGPITLRTITGMGPEEGPTVPDSPRFWHQRLSTRIELVSSSDQVVLAKCHLSYRDDQWDPWIGPCIEAMSVNPLHRGQGWLSMLWHQGVVPFLRKNYPMVDYNDSESPEDNGESIQVRVIHLLGSEIDIDKKTTSLSIWDKDFYFGQVGFSILPRGLRTGVMNYMRPQDDQGIGYLSLQEEEDSKQPRVGARYCQTCGKISIECFACPKQCGGRVYYCTSKCQEEDALQHDQWCGLARAQLHEVLVQKGRRIQDSKGEWRTIL